MIGRLSGNIGIRHPTLDDCETFLRNVSDSKAIHNPWVHPPFDRTSYKEYLGCCEKSNMIGLLVFEKASLKHVGVINISEIVRGAFQSAYVGFYVFSPMQGRGYLTEALTLTVRYCFIDLRLHRLEANIQPDNTRSIQLVKRCGFKKEGFSPRYLKIDGKWRDHERWAIVRA